MDAEYFMKDLHAMIKCQIDIQMIDSGAVHASVQHRNDLAVAHDMHAASVGHQIDTLMRVAESYKPPIRYR